MELQILKIERDKINFLKEVKQIIEANPYNDIKGIYLDYIMDDKIKLSIEYKDKNSIMLLFTINDGDVENVGIYNNIGHEIVPTNTLFDDIENIKNLIENYKDEIENKYKAKLIEVRNGFYLNSQNIFIYKIDEVSYIYRDDVYTITMNKDNIVEIKVLDKSVRDNFFLSKVGKDFIEKIKSLNETQINKAFSCNVFKDKNTEYVNEEHLYNRLNDIKEKYEKKYLVFRFAWITALTATCSFIFSLPLVPRGSINLLKYILTSSILCFISYYLTKRMVYLEDNVLQFINIISDIKFEDSYVRWGDIEYKLYEFGLGKYTDEVYSLIHKHAGTLRSVSDDIKQIIEEEPAIEHNNEIFEIPYIKNEEYIKEIDEINTELNETNILIKKIQEKGLYEDNKTIFKHQLPILEKHLENLDIMKMSGKNIKLLINSITLLNERLKEILDDYKDEEDMELSAELQALYDSLL